MEVRRLEPDGPSLGEVVLYRDPVLGHVVHRLLWRWPLVGTPRWAYTKGDAIPFRDRRVEADRLLGKVVRVLGGGGETREGGVERWRRLLRSIVAMVLHRLGRARGRTEPVEAGRALEDRETCE